MLSAERIPTIIAGIATFTYILLLSGLVFNELTIMQTLSLLSFMVIMLLLLGFIGAPVANHFLNNSLSQSVSRIYSGKSTEQERTETVRLMMQVPAKMAVQVAAAFAFCMAADNLVLLLVFDIRNSTFIFISVACIFGAYNAAILAHTFAMDLCRKHAARISAMGLDGKFIKKHKFFGISLYRKVVLYTVIPVFLSSIMIFTYFFFADKAHVFKTVLMMNSFIILFLNTLMIIMNSFFLFKKVSQSFRGINSSLNAFATGRINETELLPVDLSDQISYNNFLINEIISFVKDMVDDSARTSSGILSSISRLSEISKSTADLSQKEADSVKDSLMKMEKATELLEKITDRIADVRFTAENTRNTVDESTELLGANIDKMSEITDANLDTITGIKNLSVKIETVWDIINTIDSIAVKTKIIAFNAELEASYAGTQGEKFHIIANEIRRLASTISDSIQEIKEQVTQIQHSSDNLIITSEASTQKISEGREFYTGLEEQFTQLRMSSDITAESATQIQDSTNNQDSSFIQIDEALREISVGFNKFASSAKRLNESSEKIREIAVSLNQIHSKEDN